MSNLAIKTNYFNYIYDAINKIEVRKQLEETENVHKKEEEVEETTEDKKEEDKKDS